MIWRGVFAGNEGLCHLDIPKMWYAPLSSSLRGVLGVRGGGESDFFFEKSQFPFLWFSLGERPVGVRE